MELLKGLCTSIGSVFSGKNVAGMVAAAAVVATSTAVIAHKCYAKQATQPKPKQRESHLAPSARVVSLREGTLPLIPQELRIEIMAYLRGEAPTVQITESNYREVLHAVKVIDLELDRVAGSRRALKFSTYELRTRCLVASKGVLHSYEAYTKSIDPKYFKNPYAAIAQEYAARPENYVPERVRIHSTILQKHVVDCSALSKRLKLKKPALYALRGNIGAGKTHMSKTDPVLAKGINDNGEMTGVLAPDGVKALLMKEVDGVVNFQVHIEGRCLSKVFTEDLQRRFVDTSVVRDERFLHVEDITRLIAAAKQSGRALVIKDMEVPVVLSACRVLGRNVDSEPCAPPQAITDGAIASRASRKAIVDLVAASAEVTEYELYVTDSTGKRGLAAQKRNGQMTVLDAGLYKYATSKDGATAEVAALADATISPELCAPFVNCGLKVDSLKPFMGKNVTVAVQRHSMTLPQRKKT